MEVQIVVEKKQIVCAGVITLDALALVDGYPAPDSRVEASLVQISGGGPAANAAVVLARQGESVAFVGRVGDDAAGEQAVALLEAEGVDVSGVCVLADTRTQASCIIVDRNAGTRAISTQRMPVWESLDSVARDIVSDAHWVHVDHLGFNPVKEFLAQSRGTGIISLDAGNPVHGLELAYVDLFVPTVSSLSQMFGIPAYEVEDAASQAIAAGAGAVVATDGANGSSAWWTESWRGTESSKRSGSVHVRAHGSADIVSTLGAGDVFHGALVAALVRGESWGEALNSANVTAALSCRALDGREKVPTLSELRETISRSD